MHDGPKLIDANPRCNALMHELRVDRSPCPFVVDEQAAKHVALSHYSGGRDATYVLVSRRENGQHRQRDVAVRIGYAPFVEGTTIIYDLTDEMMQGKARPFDCDLARRTLRLYALLPFQIEETSVRSEATGEDTRLVVAFLEGGGETIQAALAFELRLIDADDKILQTEYHATDRQGHWSRAACSLAGASKVVVRSLLTGQEERVGWAVPTIPNHEVGGAHPVAPATTPVRPCATACICRH